jgi:ABC-type Mn2+/Zn2+ transport system permease subunit
VSSVIAGLAASRIWGLAPGGIIVLIAASVFVLVALVRRGVGARLQASEGADV